MTTEKCPPSIDPHKRVSMSCCLGQMLRLSKWAKKLFVPVFMKPDFSLQATHLSQSQSGCSYFYFFRIWYLSSG